jgi:hypothetical protein
MDGIFSMVLAWCLQHTPDSVHNSYSPTLHVSANCFLEVEANLPSSNEKDDILTVVDIAISWCL